MASQAVPSTSAGIVTTNWNLCIFCQRDDNRPVSCPGKTKRKDSGAGYHTAANNLEEFAKLGHLPFKACRDIYNNTKLQRLTKQSGEEDSETEPDSSNKKFTRAKADSKITASLI